MSEILFHNLEISPTKIEVQATHTDDLALYFQFDRAVPVSTSQVALALAALCGRSFSSIGFDFDVDVHVATAIRTFTKATVRTAAERESVPAIRRSGNVLSFSGGFDSLTAVEIMPRDTHLVSLDFGGWFSREAEFFEKFDTLRIETNVRRVPDQNSSLARNSHAFMAIGALLTSEYFGASHHTFGQILGDSILRSGPLARLLLEAVGLQDAPYTLGLSEIATARIPVQARPELVAESLHSLAGARDRKLFRKSLVTQILARKYGVSLDIDFKPQSWAHTVPFSPDTATTIVALYCIAEGELDAVANLFTGIPESAISFARGTDMSFLEKYNPDYYSGFPAGKLDALLEKFDELGVLPYSNADMETFEVLRNYLKGVEA
ncbi:hypothetical protein [Agrococcus casei]|uniref:hypothetical protein n=1 Tax=Agrococcus casei TaxID=343512 RepID=UPI003F9CCCF4